MVQGHNFYPRSPCGERPTRWMYHNTKFSFLSTLSLRRATYNIIIHYAKKNISIHALLAESDCYSLRHSTQNRHFYPRSPCGERLLAAPCRILLMLFLSTLSLRRATLILCYTIHPHLYFYPRSPCGERLHYDNYNLHCVEISIHALLAESDKPGERHASSQQEFLSTLSLRRATHLLII